MKYLKCNRCKSELSVDNFRERRNRGRRGYEYTCIKCTSEGELESSRTKEGVCRTIYKSQMGSSKKRGNNPPNYSKTELCNWMMNQDIFHDLYDKWVESGYDTWEKPSVDRDNDYSDYSLDSIQIMTWRENKNKYYQTVRDGENSKWAVKVDKYDLRGNYISTYYSMTEAARVSNTTDYQISKAIKGNALIAGGFFWRKNGDSPPPAMPERYFIMKSPVQLFSIDGVYVREFTSIKEAADFTGINNSSIRDVCLGKRLTASGYKFKYKLDDRDMSYTVDITKGKAKKVQCTRDEFSIIYESLTMASSDLGISSTTIGRAIKSNEKVKDKYLFKFI